MEQIIEKVKESLLNGETLASIGKQLGISRQRVHQIRNEYLKDLNRTNSGKQMQIITREQKWAETRQVLFGRPTHRPRNELEAAQSQYFIRKKQSAKTKGQEWLITPNDLHWPEICPVLGIEINWFASKICDNSPSMDRVDSTKGYVPGNVTVISQRANRIKNDGTAEEHRLIADYIINHSS